MLQAIHPAQEELAQALASQGLSLRGHWFPTAADALPTLPNGQNPGVVWMVGVIGSAFWPHFKNSTCFSDGLPDPLDRWSRAIGEALAQRLGGLALYPFEGPPYWPFQRWADRAEATQASRMLLRIHPDYGLWHAYRFALALPQESLEKGLEQDREATAEPANSLCASCHAPCLQACPVQAYTGETFLLQACADHLHSGQGEDCMQSGCLARRACPVGIEKRYTAEHAAFHMRAFGDRH
jgi:ferredoxin